MDKLDQLKQTLDSLAEAREDAKPRIVAAIRELERSLKLAIGASALRGMPDLHRDDALRIRGLVVRSHRKDRLRIPEPGDFTSTLILRPEGDLVILEVDNELEGNVENVDIETRPIRDDEFLVSDLRAVLETANYAIQEHLRRVDRTTAQWESAGHLADRLIRVLTTE